MEDFEGAKPIAPWMPLDDVRERFHEVNNEIGENKMAHQLLVVRVEALEKANDANTKRWEKQEEQMNEMLDVMRRIEGKMNFANSVANGVIRIFGWGVGVALALLGIFYVRK